MFIKQFTQGEEMKKLKSRYVFGHFELPNFKMNAMVEMPDHGGLNAGHFPNQELVFSGHFHKRQQKGNVVYIGNAFPHNYADAWDDDRGMMILEHGKKPEYRVWDDAPKFKVVKLSQLIDDADKIIKPKQHLRVALDIDISYEEATFIKETFVRDYGLREMALIPNKTSGVDVDLAPGDVKFESVDQIVTDQLTNIESEFYDNKLLLKIYQNL